MSSAPIAPSSGLYVPIHKRSSSSRSSSSTRSDSSSDHSSVSPSPSLPIYSRDALLRLGHSPLARLSLDARDALRARVPEIVTNRRQRKALEYHAHIQPISTPVRVQPRRNRPAGRAPERRRNATLGVDDAGWRGRRVVATPIAV